MMKISLMAFMAATLAISSLCTFVFLLYTASSDAQGAIALLILAIPLFFLIWGGIWFGDESASSKIGVLAKKGCKFLLVLIGVFYLSSIFPATRFISDGYIGAVSVLTKTLTGKSPYEWSHEK